MGNLYQTRKNKRSTQLTLDASADKECDPYTPDSLHISNTETTHLISSAKEKLDMYTLTKTFGSLLMQARETSMSSSCMSIIPTQY